MRELIDWCASYPKYLADMLAGRHHGGISGTAIVLALFLGHHPSAPVQMPHGCGQRPQIKISLPQRHLAAPLEIPEVKAGDAGVVAREERRHVGFGLKNKTSIGKQLDQLRPCVCQQALDFRTARSEFRAVIVVGDAQAPLPAIRTGSV